MHWSNELEKMGACEDAVAWAKTQPTARKAWQVCPRGDWLLWYAARRSVDHKLIVLAACDCVETALRFAPKGEDRPAEALRVVRAWCSGEATLAEVEIAQHAAAAAAHAAAAAAAAAYAAAYPAADAAYAAAHAAADATPAAAAGRKHATLVRRRIKFNMLKGQPASA